MTANEQLDFEAIAVVSRNWPRLTLAARIRTSLSRASRFFLSTSSICSNTRSCDLMSTDCSYSGSSWENNNNNNEMDYLLANRIFLYAFPQSLLSDFELYAPSSYRDMVASFLCPHLHWAKFIRNLFVFQDSWIECSFWKWLRALALSHIIPKLGSFLAKWTSLAPTEGRHKIQIASSIGQHLFLCLIWKWHAKQLTR